MKIDKNKFRLSDEKLDNLSGGQLYVTQEKSNNEANMVYHRYSLIGKDKHGNSYNLSGMTKEDVKNIRNETGENLKFIDTDEF